MKFILLLLTFYSFIYAEITNILSDKQVTLYDSEIITTLTDNDLTTTEILTNTEYIVIDLGAEANLSKVKVSGIDASKWELLYNDMDNTIICTNSDPNGEYCYDPLNYNDELQVMDTFTAAQNEDTLDFSTLDTVFVTSRYIAIKFYDLGETVSEIEVWGSYVETTLEDSVTDESEIDDEPYLDNIFTSISPIVKSLPGAQNGTAEEYAIDGDPSTKYCSSMPTNIEDPIWWQVDLGDQYDLNISDISTINIKDGWYARFDHISMVVSPEPFDSKSYNQNFKYYDTYKDNIPLNLTARYIRFTYNMKSTGSTYGFCIPEFGLSGKKSKNQIPNVAFGKKVSQSSTQEDSVTFQLLDPEFAVDGLTSLNISPYELSVASTKSYAEQNLSIPWHQNRIWWEVDLGYHYEIKDIVIYKGNSNQLVNMGKNIDEDIFTYTNLIVSNTPFSTNPKGDSSFTIGNLHDKGNTSLNINKTARYIRIEPILHKTPDLDNSDLRLSLGEVLIYGVQSNLKPYLFNTGTYPDNFVNAAYGAKAKQSSTWENYVASNALDPDTKGAKTSYLSYPSVTELEKNPWWEVDLGAEYDVAYLSYDGAFEGTYSWHFSRVPFETDPIGLNHDWTNSPFSFESAGPFQFFPVEHSFPIYEQESSFIGSTIDEKTILIGSTNGVARYIRIIGSDAKRELSLSNFKAFGVKREYSLPDGSINAAYGKNTSQSSIYTMNGFVGSPSHCVDGDPFTSCKTEEGEGWWEVDLGALYEISQITLNSDATVIISNSPISENSPDIQKVEIKSSDIKKIKAESSWDYFEGVADINLTGRFVRIVATDFEAYEIKVYGVLKENQVPDNYSNIASNKHVSQISVYDGNTPSYAIDGDLSTTANTMWEANSWWEIDLGEYYSIYNIEISDKTRQNLEGATIKISNLPFNINPKGDHQFILTPNYTSDTRIIEILKSGRFVRVEHNTSKPITIDEIKIHGEKTQKPDSLNYEDIAIGKSFENKWTHWEMDLGAEYDLRSVVFLVDSNNNSLLQDSNISFSRVPTYSNPKGDLQVNLTNIIGDKVTIDLNQSVRYIRIDTSASSIAFDSLSVYASKKNENPFPEGITNVANGFQSILNNGYWTIDLSTHHDIIEIEAFDGNTKLANQNVLISRVPFDTNPFGDANKTLNTRFDPIQGRYVSIKKTIGENISFKIYGKYSENDISFIYYRDDTNTYENVKDISFHKGVNANSGTNLYQLVDGRVDTFTTLSSSDKNWFEIDLEGYYEVNGIELITTNGSGKNALKNINVQFSSFSFDFNKETPESINLSDDSFTDFHLLKNIELKNKKIRYVRIEKNSLNDSFTLGLIRVFGFETSYPENLSPNIGLNKNIITSPMTQNKEFVLDGNESTKITLDVASNPYIIIDLGAIYDIDTIELLKAISWDEIAKASNDQKLVNSTIYFSNVPFSDNPLGDIHFSPILNDFQTRSENNTSVTAQYVKLQINGDNRILTLSDIIIRGKLSSDQQLSNLINTTYLKPTKQSDSKSYAQTEHFAVDGDIDGTISMDNITTVKYIENQKIWWEVDLGKEFKLSKIEIYTPKDASIPKFNKSIIKTSKVPFETNPDGDFPILLDESNNTVVTHSFEQEPIGRYVRIEQLGTQDMHLAEVKVYGILSQTQLPKGLKNVAYQKLVQSEDHLANENYLVDGNQSSSIYNYIKDHWIEIDLGAVYDISQIEWYGMSEDYNALNQIGLSNTDINTFEGGVNYFNFENPKTKYAPFGYKNYDVYYMKSDLNQTARYIRVNNIKGSLNEIKVYGKYSADQSYSDSKNLIDLTKINPMDSSAHHENNQDYDLDIIFPSLKSDTAYIIYDLGSQAQINELNFILVANTNVELLVSKVPFDTNPEGDYKVALDSATIKELDSNKKQVIQKLGVKARYIKLRALEPSKSIGIYKSKFALIGSILSEDQQYPENYINTVFGKTTWLASTQQTIIDPSVDYFTTNGVDGNHSSTTDLFDHWVVDLGGYYDLSSLEIFGEEADLRKFGVVLSSCDIMGSTNLDDYIFLTSEETSGAYNKNRITMDINSSMIRYIHLKTKYGMYDPVVLSKFSELKAYGTKSQMQYPKETQCKYYYGSSEINLETLQNIERLDLINVKKSNPDDTPFVNLYSGSQSKLSIDFDNMIGDDYSETYTPLKTIHVNSALSKIDFNGFKEIKQKRLLYSSIGDRIPNIALHKLATQSSTFGGSYASHVIDGIKNNFSYTKKEKYPWLQIDLGKTYFVDTIIPSFSFNESGNAKVSVSAIPFEIKPLGDKIFNIVDLNSTNETTIQVDKEVRYIKIDLNATDNLSLKEVVVGGYDAKFLNQALYQPTKQSTTYGESDSSLAVDGIIQIDDVNFSAHTLKNGTQYWRVDLGNLYDIYKVEIIPYNKNDDFSKTTLYLSEKTLEQSLKVYPFKFPSLTTHANVVKYKSYDFIPNKTGRYLQLSDPKELRIKEVKVYGVLNDPAKFIAPAVDNDNDSETTGGSSNNQDTNDPNNGNNPAENNGSEDSPTITDDPKILTPGALVDYIKSKLGDGADLIPDWLWDILGEIPFAIENPKFESGNGYIFKINGNILLGDLSKFEDNPFGKVIVASLKAITGIFDMDSDGKIPIELFLKNAAGNNGYFDFGLKLVLADSWQYSPSIPPLDSEFAFKSMELIAHAKGNPDGIPSFSVENISEFYAKPSARDKWMSTKLYVEPEISLSGDVSIALAVELSGACMDPFENEDINGSTCTQKWDLFNLGMVRSNGGMLKISFSPDNVETFGISAVEGYVYEGQIGDGTKVTSSFRGEIPGVKPSPEDLQNMVMGGTGVYLFANEISPKTYFSQLLPLPKVTPIKETLDVIGTGLSIFGSFDDTEFYFSPSINGFSVGNVEEFIKSGQMDYPSDREPPSLSRGGFKMQSDLNAIGVSSSMHVSATSNIFEVLGESMTNIIDLVQDPIKIMEAALKLGHPVTKYSLGGDVNFDNLNETIESGAGSVPLLGPVLEEIVTSFQLHEAKFEFAMTHNSVVPEDIDGGAELKFSIFGQDLNPKIDFGVLFSPFKYIIDFIKDLAGDLGKIVLKGLEEAGKAIAKAAQAAFDAAEKTAESIINGANEIADSITQETSQLTGSISKLLDKPSAENLLKLGEQLLSSAAAVASEVGAALVSIGEDIGNALSCLFGGNCPKPFVAELNNWSVFFGDWYLWEGASYAESQGWGIDKRTWNDWAFTSDKIQGAPWFSWDEYLDLNPIVYSVIGSNTDKKEVILDIFKNWQNSDGNNSMYSGALGSRKFSAPYYALRYKDLDNSKGYAGAIQHYYSTGYYENRTAYPVKPVIGKYIHACRTINSEKGILSGNWNYKDRVCSIGHIDGSETPSHAFEILRIKDYDDSKSPREYPQKGYSVVTTGGLMNGSVNRSKVCKADGSYGYTDYNSSRGEVCVISNETKINTKSSMQSATTYTAYTVVHAKQYSWSVPDTIDLSGELNLGEGKDAEVLAINNDTLWIYGNYKIYHRNGGQIYSIPVDAAIFGNDMHVDNKGHLWFTTNSFKIYEFFFKDGKIYKQEHTQVEDEVASQFKYGHSHNIIAWGKDGIKLEYNGNLGNTIFIDHIIDTNDNIVVDSNGALWIIDNKGVIHFDPLSPTYLKGSILNGLRTDRFNLNDLNDMNISTLQKYEEKAKLVSIQTGVELTFTTDAGGIFRVKASQKNKAITAVDILKSIPDGVTAIQLFDVNNKIFSRILSKNLTIEQELQLESLGYYLEDVYYDLGTGSYIKVTIKTTQEEDIPEEAEEQETTEIILTNEKVLTMDAPTLIEGFNPLGNTMNVAFDAREVFNTDKIYTYLNGKWNDDGIVQPGQAFWVVGLNQEINSTINGSQELTKEFIDDTKWNFLVATQELSIGDLASNGQEVLAYDHQTNTWHNEEEYKLNIGDVYWIGPINIVVSAANELPSDESMTISNLKLGWNLLGNTMETSNIKVDQYFGTSKAYTYNFGEWKEGIRVEPGQSFWIYIDTNDSIADKNITGILGSRSAYKSVSNWNLLSAQSDMLVEDLGVSKDKIFVYDNNDSSWHNEYSYQIKKGQGYWISGLPMQAK